MQWSQKTIQLPSYARGCHLITKRVLKELDGLSSLRIGLLHVFIQHTSASLSINENADPDVRQDLELALNHLVPESLNYVHTIEGPDDMPAHVKSSLLGSSLTIPITEGKLAFGTWQGIYLCEHRDRARGRSLVLTVLGTD
ncbi:MAG TPA: secondary thiamine-phosphate synthase enzyme YjbQ [Pirellula sp.]|nr:secondary thiamine-phosphate synthase enzyme YjbQ [Pirellula sp.]